ncbi:MAG: transcriptional regulator, TetR family [Blastococcus sp.]|jgi:AcrR family transcriptional regulator|nr:transcriptional regulator, TetR family [Blastococcus sp.]
MSEEPVEPLNRRDRARADTLRAIKDTARRVLVDQGVDGLALRAVAREMGMTAPGLYRYFDSREDLVENVVADLYDELVTVLEAARDAARPTTAPIQLLACSREFRRWATTHRAEFGLLFGSAGDGVVPAHGAPDHEASPAELAAQRFGAVFAVLVAQIYLERGFAVPADDEIEPPLQEQLQAWCAKFPVQLPLGVMQVFLSCWIRLYGLVCMEVFGHLRFALNDAGPMFEAELHGLAEVLGVADAYAELERA